MKSLFALVLKVVVIVSCCLFVTNWVSNTSSKKIEYEMESNTNKLPDCFHLVVFYFNGLADISRYNGSNIKKIEQRQDEMDLVIRRNADNPSICMVHLLTENVNESSILASAMRKSQYINVNAKVGQQYYGQLIEYIADNLLGKPVIIANTDILFVNGLNLVNTSRLQEGNLMMSLSRWENESLCLPKTKPNELENFVPAESKQKGMCGPSYQGSHDSHIFVLTQSSNREDLKILNFPHHGTAGSENLFMWWMNTKYGYELQNPCQSVITVHCHQSNVRDLTLSLGTRVNGNGRSRMAFPRKL